MLANSQSKAQELLVSLDLARKQKVANEKVKGVCMDNEHVLQKLHHQSFATKQRIEFSRLHKKGEELLQEFERSLNFTHLNKFNVAKYLADCQQEMPITDLLKPEDEPTPQQMEAVVQVLREMRGRGDSATHYNSLIDVGTKLMEKNVALLNDSKLHSEEWAKAAEPLLNLLREVMNQSPIRSALVEADEDVKRMQFNIEECSQAQIDALSEGEMQQAETLYYQKLQMQESYCELVKKKFSVLETQETTAFRLPIKRVHEIHNKANLDIANILKQKERLKARAQADLQRLVAEVERTNMADYTAAKTAAEEKEKSNYYLKENTLRQDQCWKQMEDLEKELLELGGEREAEIKQRIKRAEREERRKVEYNQFLDFATQHRKLLELTVRNCEIAEEITDTMDEFISSACNTIERRMREIEKEIEAIRLEIHTEYFQAFRSLYLTVGDLEYKKEKNVEELEKKIQVAHIHQELAMDTFNPKAKEYSQEKKALIAVRESIEGQITALRQKATAYIEWFEPSEKALIEAGREFKHPVEELKEINESRKNKLIEYHELMTKQEDDETEYAEEMAEIERLRALTEQHPRITAGPGTPSRRLMESLNRSTNLS
eukprot:TRINITY_DN808_c0_g1_i3.p1 TRINITY_DN808_c0_g1~~TRINITY_DN808_c0_g1_i3.p1  ORF type:complete len:605 (+),score=165.93 TRINITY_DN808_c0_g1_i3:50-1864(+)